MSGIVAVVTGHSRGIGAGVAEQLLARGVRVLGLARHKNADLAKRFPALLKQGLLDLADSEKLTRWLAGGALHRFLDGHETALLVNNAGVLQPIGPLASQDPAAVSRAVAVNVGAPLMLSAAFVAATAAAKERRILHISSGAGRKPYAGWAVYCATKAALDHHARAVALDRTPALKICSLAPGVIDTDMQAEIRASTDALFPERQRFVDMKREGKLYDPGNRAGAAVDYLLSDAFGSTTIVELRDITP